MRLENPYLQKADDGACHAVGAYRHPDAGENARFRVLDLVPFEEEDVVAWNDGMLP
jgi:hypothetical protein